MQKKAYMQPTMKVVKLEHADIICQSQIPSPQNERYEDGDTSGWFN